MVVVIPWGIANFSSHTRPAAAKEEEVMIGEQGHNLLNEDAEDGGRQRLSHVVREIAGCQSALYAYVCSLLGTSAGAADVVQEANVVLWETAREYDPARPFLPWAYRIAYFQVLAHRKRRSRDKLLFDDELLGTVTDALRRRDESA